MEKANDKSISVRVSHLDGSERDSRTKGLATVTINGNIAIHGVKIVGGDNGDFISMPSRKNSDGEYEDVVFPITADFREELSNAVLDEFLNPQESSEKEKPNATDFDSMVVSIKPVDFDKIKAFAQVELNSSIVITGIKVINSAEKGLFVAMPNYQDRNGEYQDIANPVTADFREKLYKAVLNKYQISQSETIGNVPFKELGEREQLKFYGKLNNKFAADIANELTQRGVKFSGKKSDTTTLTVNKESVPAYEEAVSAVKARNAATIKK